jgi:hypothetical protein
MENQQEPINMMTLFKRMLQEQRAMSEVASVVERLMHRHGQFNGKDVPRYFRDYKAEMLRCGISEGVQVFSSIGWLRMNFKGAFLRLGNNTQHGQRSKEH